MVGITCLERSLLPVGQGTLGRKKVLTGTLVAVAPAELADENDLAGRLNALVTSVGHPCHSSPLRSTA